MRVRTLVVVACVAGLLVVALGAFIAGRASTPSAAPAPTPSVVETPDGEPLPQVGVEPLIPSVPVVLRPGTDLPVKSGFAIGYAPVDTDIDREQLAGHLAGVFGVEGSVARRSDGSFVVGPGGNGTLTVRADDLVSWQFDGPSLALFGKLPSKDDARTVVEQLLRELGVMPDEVEWQVTTAPRRITVTAWQRLDGYRTDLSWSVSLGADLRVLSATGFAATLQPTDPYPLISAVAAIDRSHQPGWSAFGPSLIRDTETPAEVEPTASAATAPLMNRPIVVGGVRELDVTSAELGLAQHRQVDGSILIVPAYRLTADDGSTWSIVAVADPYTRLAPVPPSPSPSASPVP